MTRTLHHFISTTFDTTSNLFDDAASLTDDAVGGAGKLVYGSDVRVTTNAANVVPKKGWVDVVVHGTEDGKAFKINGEIVTPQQLYNMMLKGGYQQGTRIRLNACYSGSLENGAAYQLSKLANAPVVAPRSWLTIHSGENLMRKGSFWVGDGLWWRTFR